jgi:hypothetical protein
MKPTLPYKPIPGQLFASRRAPDYGADVTRGLLGAALACVALAWLLLAGGDPRTAEHEHARVRSERITAHTQALRAVDVRLASLEALPPELLARTLAEVARAYPEFARLMVCDATGRVLAVEPARDTALIGALDPSEVRRAALTGVKEDVRYAGARGATVELGVAAGGRYVAGDLPEHAFDVKIIVLPSARMIASWALAVIALLFTAGAAVISSKRRS